MSIYIRQYLPEDEAALTENTIGRYADDLKNFIRSRIHVAEYNGKIAGWSYANIRISCAEMSYISVYVFESCRRHGIGTALYREAEKRCVDSGSRELYVEYYEADGKHLADKLGFSFTTSSAIMEHNGKMLPNDGSFIRGYKPEDSLRFGQIWSEGMDDMHRRIGIKPDSPDYRNEEMKKIYNDNSDDEFVIEYNGDIVAVGAVSDNMIGMLATDLKQANKGFGKKLAVFLTNELILRGYSNPILA